MELSVFGFLNLNSHSSHRHFEDGVEIAVLQFSFTRSYANMLIPALTIVGMMDGWPFVISVCHGVMLLVHLSCHHNCGDDVR